MEFVFNCLINQRFPVFGAEHNMEVIGYERLSHVYFYFALSGLCFYCFYIRWAAPIANGFSPFRAFSNLITISFLNNTIDSYRANTPVHPETQVSKLLFRPTLEFRLADSLWLLLQCAFFLSCP
jgi:hypothetical protein